MKVYTRRYNEGIHLDGIWWVVFDIERVELVECGMP